MAAPQVQSPADDLERLLTSFETHYTWDYQSTKDGLRELYEKAKRDQWNSTTQLDWNLDVDPEGEILSHQIDSLEGFAGYEKLDQRERRRLRHAEISLNLSQFLHGEQGALIVASQLVGGVPWIEAKYYAGTQTMDEARHVEVFSRYLHEKLEWEWPINPALKELLDAAIGDSRWDFKYLAMQVLIEGLAMAAFGHLYLAAVEPLLKELLKYVMKDESRHVAFGILSLRGYYEDMPANELADREDFIVYASELMRNRLLGVQIAEAMGWDVREVQRHVLESEAGLRFRSMLFMRVVPNLKKLGLLTPKVREAFERLQILQFEDYDPEQSDRELGFL